MAPFVERELVTHLGENWESRVNDGLKRPLEKDANGKVHWDSYAILKVMWDQWNTTFRTPLGKTERSFVSELTDVRNDHAHEKKFSYDDTERALDTMRNCSHLVHRNMLQELERFAKNVFGYNKQKRPEMRQGKPKLFRVVRKQA